MDISKSSKLSLIISLCLIVFAYLFSIHAFLDQFIDMFYWNKFKIGNPYYFQEENIIKFEEHAHCEATIVTAYFKMRSKHTYEEYILWMSNMLAFRDCMVIFTDQKSAILEHRNETLPTVIISLFIETTMVYNMLTDVQWWIMENMDPEKDKGHNKKLYSVWNEKTNFMKTAADKNYFNSNYFLWLDIGAVRHEAHKNMTLVRRLPLDDGVLLLSLGNFTQEDLEVSDKGKSLKDFRTKVHLGGGAIGCPISILDKWHAKFYENIRFYIKTDRFLGKDQNVMASTCIETGMCLLVPTNPLNWFGLQDFFIGNIPNQTYQRFNTDDRAWKKRHLLIALIIIILLLMLGIKTKFRMKFELLTICL